MDAGLAAPLFLLLKHQDVDLQIAATAVVCNLVLDFSPMRDVRESVPIDKTSADIIPGYRPGWNTDNIV